MSYRPIDWGFHSRFKYSDDEKLHPYSEHPHGETAATMTIRPLLLIQILVLGTLLAACSSPERASHRIPAPQTEPAAEQSPESEDRAHSADERGAGSRQRAAAQESGPSAAGPQSQEPDASGPTQPEGETAAVRTEDERVAILERKLEEDLRRYDEQIHEEFEKAQAERQAHEPATGDGLDPAPGLEEDGPAQGPNKDAGPVAKAESPQPEAGSDPEKREEHAQDRLGKGSHSVPLPADLPSGDDDDVVARQLREAALKEQDPVLREKLWDEYRAYKKQQASVNTPPSGAEY